jgi:hypothetical protein
MHVNTGGVYGECTQALERIYEEHKEEMDQVGLELANFEL